MDQNLFILRFTLKNRLTVKPYLMTSNNEEVVKTGRNLIIGPYGKDKTVMFSLNSINLDVVGGGTFACKLISKSLPHPPVSQSSCGGMQKSVVEWTNPE